jgi:hypothetical protein
MGRSAFTIHKLQEIPECVGRAHCSCAVQHLGILYLTAFGGFRRPPWKELSCKLQTALAQAQQEHGFCVKHGVCG